MADNKLKLHPKPKQPIGVNKPLIITSVIVVVTVLLLAIISAFNTSDTIKPKKDEATKTKLVANEEIISPEIKNLPGSYSDIDGIKKFYSGQTDNFELSLLLKQIRNLENEQQLLKEQLASRTDSSLVEKPSSDPKDQQAKAAGLAFSGLEAGMNDMLGGPDDKKQTFGKKDEAATEGQDEIIKKAVQKAKDRPEEIYDLHNVVSPYSKYQVQAGTVIPATLVTGINTTVPGTIIAQVRQNVYDTVTGKHLLIPKGTKILGEYSTRVAAGQQRVLMAFTRLVRPNGSSILLGKPTGADLLGNSGLEGNVDNHWAQVLGAATISTILSVGAGIASDHSSSDDNRNSLRYNSRQRGLMGGAQGISDVGNMLTSKYINISPTITLPPGYNFIVTVKKDMVLTPYKTRV